ncbi:MAG TPA: metal ABC transporter substrate-binding protein [Nitrospira sp.]|nr:metal ABC transporter substrate-binding protein [Nitrospira sp.]
MSILWNLAGSLRPFTAHAVEEPLDIVVTIPVLKDFAEQIGGSHVRVTSLLKGYESEHTYSPKPSDLVAVRNARLLFEVGIGLEVWVASLVKNAGRDSLRVVTTSQGIALLENGHRHGARHNSGEGSSGNPHIWLDPEHAATMVRHMSAAMSEMDPSHADDYNRNTITYLDRLDRTREELTGLVRNLTDRRFVAQHPAWPYLAKRFAFDIVGTIQPQSGSEPSARHLQQLIDVMKRNKVKVVASEVQLSQRLPQLLAHETGARVVVLTTLPGGLPGTETYLDMLRYNVLQLVAALKEA